MDGGRTTKRQYSEYSDFLLHNENQSTIKIQTNISGSPPKSDGADETGDASRILVWVTPRTTGRGGHMKIASIRTKLEHHDYECWNIMTSGNFMCI